MRPLKLFRKLRRDQRGSATVEFGLMAPLFLALLLVVFELGYMMLRIVTLDDAVAQASRFIYTGAATNGSVSRSEIEQFICQNAPFFNNCEQNIAIEAVVIADFGSAPNTAAACEDGSTKEITPAAAYSGGGSSEVMFLRVCVTTDMVFPLNNFGLDIEKTDNGRIEIISSTAFANEPF